MTVDRSVLIGRTNDFPPCNATMRQQICERGAQVSFGGNTNKYRYVCAPKSTSLHGGRYAGSAANEKGVILTGTITGMPKKEVIEKDPYDPVVDKDVGEPNLPDYLIGNASTAREAVELLASAVAERGHDGAEIYMVADTNEAWYVEVYTGHHWAAVKMPEDKAAVFGNHFNLRGFDTNNAENVMFSPDLVGLAERWGFIVWEDESKGIIDLYQTYSPDLWDYANYRTYWGHHAWAPSEYADPYETTTAYPLFFDPEPGRKISITDVFELMRTRYEGVNCPEENTNTSIRVIGTTKQVSCHVLQMRHALPEDYRCTLWECLAQAEHSTFLPVCMAMREFPEAYTRDQEGTFDYDLGRAADAFLRLDTLAELKRFIVDTKGERRDVRPFYGAGVRAFWREQEGRLVDEWPQLLEKWMLCGKSGRNVVNAYVNFNQVWTLADAKRLHDELAWYWTEFNCDMRDGGGATDVPTYPFASSMPTNAELGASWTRWHRTEFDAFIEDLAGPEGMRSPEVTALVAKSKSVFDDVEDSGTLAEAKEEMAEIVRGISLCRQGPLGCEGNPWAGGESVVVWTNGVGALVFEGKGRTEDFASATPWAEVMSAVTESRVAETVALGANSLKGIGAAVPVNGLVPSDLFAAVGGEDPAGAISPAEFEKVAIIDGKAYLDVSVYTNSEVKATDGGWGVATNGVIEVPAEGKSGFFYLMSKPAQPSDAPHSPIFIPQSIEE